MLVMASQTFQLNVKIFAQLYQVKIQGAVDTTIFRHSIVWLGWKNTEKGKGMQKLKPSQGNCIHKLFLPSFLHQNNKSKG